MVERFSGSFAIVVIEHPAKSSAAPDLPCRTSDLWARPNNSILKSLVVAFFVVMKAELLDCFSKGRLSEKYYSVQAFLFDAPHETLYMRGQVWGLRRKTKTVDPFAL